MFYVFSCLLIWCLLGLDLVCLGCWCGWVVCCLCFNDVWWVCGGFVVLVCLGLGCFVWACCGLFLFWFCGFWVCVIV